MHNLCVQFTELFYKLHITIHNEECQRRLDVYLHTAYGTILCICCTGLVVLYGHPACSMAICSLLFKAKHLVLVMYTDQDINLSCMLSSTQHFLWRRRTDV